jgi:hypothetical protein
MYLEYYSHDRVQQLMQEACQQRLARLARAENRNSILQSGSLKALGQVFAGVRAWLTPAPAGHVLVRQTELSECCCPA